MLRISDIEKNGVVWELSYFATKDEDPEDEGGTISTHTIVKPENLENISMIMMNGNIIYPPENFETEEETELDV